MIRIINCIILINLLTTALSNGCLCPLHSNPITEFSSTRIFTPEGDSISELLKYHKDLLYFEQNKGEWPDIEKYRLNLPGALVRFTDDAVAFTLYRTEGGASQEASNNFTLPIEEKIKKGYTNGALLMAEGGRTETLQVFGHTYNMQWLGANEGIWKPRRTHQDHYNRNRPDTNITGARASKELWQEDIYDQIDIRFYSHQNGELEYDYIIHPGGNWKSIQFNFDGIEKPEISSSGELILTTDLDQILMSRPYAYQVINGEEIQVPCVYYIDEQGWVSFQIPDGAVDEDHVLIIDPVALRWSTYYGGGQTDFLSGMLHDEQGIYLLFSTLSIDFPVTPGAFQFTLQGNQDLAVVRLDLNGNRIWSSYIGGTGFESANHIAIDDESIYIIGETSSADFPILGNAFQADRVGFSNLALCRINKQNGELIWSTYMGGSAFEFSGNLILEDDQIFVTAYTGSLDYPTTMNAFQQQPLNTIENAVISAFSKDGSLNWSTYFSAGGFNREAIIIADAQVESNKLVLTGRAPLGFPVTANAVAATNGGLFGGFLTEFDKLNGELIYSSYLQNAGEYSIYQLESDDQAYYFFGQSDDQFNHSPEAYQSDFGGGHEDLILISIDKESKNILWSTYLGGINNEVASFGNFNIRNLILSEGEIYLAGKTASRNFPTTPGAWQTSSVLPVGQKFVLAGFEANTGQLRWSTYLSTPLANASDDIISLSTSPEANLFIAGRTQTDGHFISPNAFQTIRFGGFDLIINEINRENGHPLCGSYLGGSGNEDLRSLSILEEEIIVAGNVESINFPATSNAFLTRAPSVQESGFISRISACCIDIDENIILPVDQDVCIQGTPELIEGTGGAFAEVLPEIIRNMSTFSQTGVLKAGQYVWESSQDGIIWNPIPGAFDRDLQPPPGVETRFFRRIIGCDTSNVSIVSITEHIAPIVDPGGPFVSCPDGTVILGGMPTVLNSNGPYTTIWSPGDNLDDPQMDNPTAIIDRNTIFRVEVIDSVGCRVVKNTTAFSIEPYTGPAPTLCLGDTIRIGNSPLPFNEDVVYSWRIVSGDANALVGRDDVPRPRVSPIENTLFELKIEYAGTCVFTDEILVEVQSPFDADAGPDFVICLDEKTILGGAPIDNVIYEWYPKVGLNAYNVPNPEYDGKTRSECNREMYILEIRDPQGICPSVLDTVFIDVIVAEAGKDLCGPRTIGTNDNSCNRFNYQWEVVSGDITSLEGLEQEPRPFVDPSQPTLYKLTVSFEGISCESTVFVPGCKCPEVMLEFTVPIDCDSGIQQLPFCIDLPEAPGFTVRILNEDDDIVLDDNKICLVGEISSIKRYFIEFEKGFVRCTSFIDFIPDQPVFLPLANDSIYICPSNQSPNPIPIGISSQPGFEYAWYPTLGIDDPEMAMTLLMWQLLVERQNTYTLEIKHITTGCTFTKQVDIFLRQPIADAGPDRDFCGGIFAVLGTPSKENYQYQWMPIDGLNDPTAAQPELSLFDGPGNYSYNVRVTDPESGCFSLDTVQLRVLETIVANAGEDRLICVGESVELGDPTAPTVGYTYSWTPVNGLDDPTLPNPIATPTESTEYTLIVRLDGSNPCEAIDAVTILVNDSNIIPGDFFTDLSICEPGEYTIGPDEEEGLIYLWTPTEGLSDPNIANPVATIDENTFYILTIINRENCQLMTDTLFIILEQLPPLAGVDIQLCMGDSAVIGRPAVEGVQYSWTPMDGLNNPFSAQPIASPEISTTYILNYSKGSCTFQDTMNIDILSRPIADAGADKDFCDLPVTIGPDEIQPDWIYSWTPATGLNSTTVPNPEASPTGSILYILTVVNQKGCSASDSVQVNPQIDVEINQFNYNTCQGDAIQIGPVMIDPNVTFEWQTVTFLSNSDQLRPTFTAEESGVFELSLILFKDDCTRIFDFTVTVEDPGIIQLDAASLNACEDGCVEINADISGNFSSYYWYPQEGVLDPENPNTFICPLLDGYYVLTGINAFNKCTVKDSVYINITDTPAPVADAGPDRMTCVNAPVILGTPGNQELFYNWSPSIYLSSTGAAQPVFTPLEGGSYSYLLKVEDEATYCSNIDEVVINVVDFTIQINGPDSVCTGESFELGVTFTDNPLELDINEFEFNWSPSDLLDDPVSSMPTAILDNTAFFEVMVTHIPTGCMRVAQFLVIVPGEPSPEIQLPDVIAFCNLDMPFQIPLEPQPGFTYSWQPTFRLSNPNIANPVIQAPIPVGNLYEVTVEDTTRTDGCRFARHQLRINSVLPPNIPNEEYNFCIADFPTIQIGPEPGSVPANLTFRWIPETGLINPNELNPLAPGTITTTYLLESNYQNTDSTVYAGCATLSEFFINPSVQPIANAGSDLLLCAPAEVELGGASNPFYTYSWAPADLLDRTDVPRPIASISTPGTFYLTVTDQLGCTDMDSVSVDFGEIIINLLNIEGVTCEDESAGRIEIEIIGGIAPYTVLWSTSDGGGLIPDQQNQMMLQAGTYQVLITDATGCTTIASYTVDEAEGCCDEIIFTFVPDDLIINCIQGIPSVIYPEIEDHCCEGVVDIQLEEEYYQGDCIGSLILTRTFIATDECGNTAVYVQQIDITDEIGPSVLGCADLSATIDCQGDPQQQVVDWHEQNILTLLSCAVDLCSHPVSVQSNFDMSLFISGCGNTGQIDVWYIVLDDCGNASDTLFFSLTIIDLTPPDITNCPILDATFSCDDGNLATIAAGWHSNNIMTLLSCATDLCSNSLFLGHNYNLNNFVPADCGIGGSLLVSYIVFDPCTNQSTPINAELQIIDNTAPDLSACSLPDVTIDCTAGNFENEANQWHQNNLDILANCVTDNCSDEIIITHNFNTDNFEPGCGATGSLSVDYTIADACGNESAILTATLFVGDENDIIILPCNLNLNQTIECDDMDISGVIQVWHNDNLLQVAQCGQSPCLDDPIVTSNFDLDNFIFICGQSGFITVTYLLSNGCGDETEVLQATFTVTDTQAPDISACDLPVDLTLDCSINDATIIIDWHQQNINELLNCAQDNCSDIFISDNFDELDLNISCGEGGEFSVVYIVMDECGNQSEPLTSTLIVLNNGAPDLSACGNLDQTIDCSQGDLELLANQWHQNNLDSLLSCAQTNCNNIVEILDDFDFQPGDLDCDSENVIVVNYMVVDVCGQVSEPFTATLTIEQPPTIDLSSCDLDLDATVQCNLDNEDAAEQWNQSNIDAILDCLSDICSGGFTIESDFNFSVPDNLCTEEDAIIVNYLIFNACDELVDSLTGTFTITDTIPPVITWVETAFGDIQSGDTLIVECQASLPGWDLPSFSVESVSVTDNCPGEIEIEVSDEITGQGNCQEDGYFFSIRCVWTATDACGNVDSFELIILIQDNTPPVIHGVPEDVIVNCYEVPEAPENMICPDDPDVCCQGKVWVTDACECAELSFEEQIHGEFCDVNYTILRIWTAVDNCGNIAIDTQEITVIRNFPPLLMPTTDELQTVEYGTTLTVDCDPDIGFPEWIYQLTASDIEVQNSCPGETFEILFNIIQIEDNVDCKINGYIERIRLEWLLISSCGELADYFVDLVLVDNTTPVIEGDTVVCSLEDAIVTTTGGCSEISVSFTDVEVASICPSGGIDILRTWRGENACGIAAEFDQRILNVQGEPDVQFIILDDRLDGVESGDTVELECKDFGLSLTDFEESDIQLMSACGGTIETFYEEHTLAYGDCGDFLLLVRARWFGIDPCLGEVEFAVVIALVDRTPPEFTEFEINLICGDEIRAPVVVDACLLVELELLEEVWLSGPGCEQEIMLIRTYKATDECGNMEEAEIFYTITRENNVEFIGVEDVLCDDFTIPEVTAIDPCTGQELEVSFTETDVNDPCTNGNKRIRVWQAVDICGNIHEVEQTILIGTELTPVMIWDHPTYAPYTKGAVVGLECIAPGDFSDKLNRDFSEEDFKAPEGCNLHVELERVDLNAPDCSISGLASKERLVWTATDICGNTNTFDLEIEWLDTKTPQFIRPPTDVTVGCADIPLAEDLEVVPKCVHVDIAFNEIRQPDIIGESIIRTWTATDACNNVNTHTQTIQYITEDDLSCEIHTESMPFCNSDDNILTGIVHGGQGPFQYEWVVLGGVCEIHSGQNTPQINYSIGFSSANIMLIITDASGCQTSCSLQLTCTVKPKDRIEEDGNLKILMGGIHPNPAHNELFIQYSATTTQQVNIVFIDAIGRVVIRESRELLHDKRDLRVDISRLPPGMYYLSMTGEDLIPNAGKVIKY